MLKNTFISLTKKNFFPHLYGFFFPALGSITFTWKSESFSLKSPIFKI